MTLFADLSDEQLLTEVSRLASNERHATTTLIRCLMEVDARRLYLPQGYSSLFAFCTQALHLSEHAAYGRIEVARAARRLPALLAHLEDGSITVTNTRMLAPHMTDVNCEALITAARHRSKREVEELIARLKPEPDVRSAVRKLPDPRVVQSQLTTEQPVSVSGLAASNSRSTVPAAVTLPVVPRPVVAPLAPERYKVQFTASSVTHEKLRYAQDLLRHVIPDGDVAAVFDRALSALIDRLEKEKCATTARPREPRAAKRGSRHIPGAVRREVWRRDKGSCAFVGTRGRCGERAFVEFHHVVPFAAGGAPDATNIELRCRAHNLYEAELFFGADAVRESHLLWG